MPAFFEKTHTDIAVGGLQDFNIGPVQHGDNRRTHQIVIINN